MDQYIELSGNDDLANLLSEAPDTLRTVRSAFAAMPIQPTGSWWARIHAASDEHDAFIQFVAAAGSVLCTVEVDVDIEEGMAVDLGEVTIAAAAVLKVRRIEFYADGTDPHPGMPMTATIDEDNDVDVPAAIAAQLLAG